MAIDPRTQQLLGQQLLLAGQQGGPVRSPLQGASRLLNSFVAGRVLNRGQEAARGQRVADIQLMSDLLQRRGTGQPVTAQDLAGFNNQDIAAQLAPDLFGPRDVPETRERIMGDQIIQEQFDPLTGTFTEIGRGRRFKPTGGTLTPAQIANNAEIDQARVQLEALGATPETLQLMTSETTPTGRPNPDFNPEIGRLVRISIQHKVGDDAGFESANQRIFGGASTPPAAQPTISQPAQPTPVQPSPALPAPAPLNLNTAPVSGTDPLMAPPAQPAPAAPVGATPPQPGVGGTPSGLGQPQNIPQAADGGVDFDRLNESTIYGPLLDEETGESRFVRWDGNQFVPIN